MMAYRIAILGDFKPTHPPHQAINDSIRHVQKRLPVEFHCDWIGTDIFDSHVVFAKGYAGLWVVPGSPYKSMEHVLDAIYYTRTKGIPTLGTCAGFQHMLIEFARNVCGMQKADHEETSPDASELVISKLSCSLVRQEERVTIVDPGSKLFALMKKKEFTGKYYCNYGLNNAHVDILKQHGCSMTALSLDGQVRAFEVKSHPFFLGTLFHPPMASSYKAPNPILLGFFNECIAYAKNKTLRA